MGVGSVFVSYSNYIVVSDGHFGWHVIDTILFSSESVDLVNLAIFSLSFAYFHLKYQMYVSMIKSLWFGSCYA